MSYGFVNVLVHFLSTRASACVQTNGELLRRIAGAVGAGNSSVANLTPDSTVATADQVIRRVAAALSLGVGSPTAAPPAAPSSHDAMDNRIKSLVFSAALEGLSNSSSAFQTLQTSSMDSSATLSPILDEPAAAPDASFSLAQRVFDALAAPPINEAVRPEPSLVGSAPVKNGGQASLNEHTGSGTSTADAALMPTQLPSTAAHVGTNSSQASTTGVGDWPRAPHDKRFADGQLWPGASSAMGGSKTPPRALSRNGGTTPNRVAAGVGTMPVSSHDQLSFLQSKDEAEGSGQSMCPLLCREAPLFCCQDSGQAFMASMKTSSFANLCTAEMITRVRIALNTYICKFLVVLYRHSWLE